MIAYDLHATLASANGKFLKVKGVCQKNDLFLNRARKLILIFPRGLGNYF